MSPHQISFSSFNYDDIINANKPSTTRTMKTLTTRISLYRNVFIIFIISLAVFVQRSSAAKEGSTLSEDSSLFPKSNMLFSTAALLGIIFYLGLASVGHRFFIHQLYVDRLLKLFAYGQKKVEKIQQQVHQERKIQRKLSRAISVGQDLDRMAAIAAAANNLAASNSTTPQRKISTASTTASSVVDSESDTDSAFVEDFDYDVPPAFSYHRAMTLEMDKTKHKLNLSTVMDFTALGIQAIVDDAVTKRFDAEELKSWNLLTRTDKIYHYKSIRLASIWFAGLIVRYFILFPFRLFIAIIGGLWLVFVMFLIGLIPGDTEFKRFIYYYMSIMCFRILSRAFSTVITFHDSENKAKPGGLCVANHTSPIDCVILHCNNAYALVGQRHSGMLGFFERALSRATHHIWFDRFEINDRLGVSQRLREHAQDQKKLPILIFPEGTCINNSAVMMFKKGSFEIEDAPIYPVAIKYDARFGDPFWNSSKYGYGRYLLMMMTSWAIVCDVWFLPPMYRRKDENAIEFASRVKAEIAKKGGLVDLEWDGQLKRKRVKPELIQRQQYEFCKTIEN